MNDKNEYLTKYLKYKNKYLNLLKIKKGGMVNSDIQGNIKVAVCTLNQWSMDFIGNEERIVKSIIEAKNKGAKIISLPELSTSGYNCQDHFIERETIELSFNIIKHLINTDISENVLISIGCPIIHYDVRYNTNIFIANKKIILIRPKINLADDGNYREARWFTAWPKDKYEIFNYIDINGNNQECPIGIGIINCNNILISAEICEELWAPDNMNYQLYLNGVDILINCSGSHFEAGKLQKRINLIKNTTQKCGGAYIYSNLEGCDGDRLYFDGASMVGFNGTILDIENRFTLRDVQVLVVDIPISLILSYRLKNNSFEHQASLQKKFNIISIEINLISDKPYILKGGTLYKENIEKFNKIPEILNIINAASCWLWDYLRRSGAMGFMLPLSGGADSAATATIVYNMCKLMFFAYKNETLNENFIANKNITEFINRFFTLKNNSLTKITINTLCNRILNTVYLPTNISGKNDLDKNDNIQNDENIENIIIKAASMKTGYLSSQLAKQMGARHDVIDIQGMFEAGINGITSITGITFDKMTQSVEDGRKLNKSKSNYDLLYQNIQARLRMINTYLLAQALPNIISDYKNQGFNLVLGSSNADEILVGYYTKYDASAADINPIGSLSKHYVNEILDYYSNELFVLKYIRASTPTAELIKTDEDIKQTDEIDMGITYKQIYELGKLRAMGYGPIDSYLKIKADKNLIKIFSLNPIDKPINPKDVIKIFYFRYNMNRNKATIIPPSVHLLPSPDDNRYDLRPFLYRSFGKMNWETKIISNENLSKQIEVIDSIE
jgi:NAD+ synthase (glutamine-hydrolysing)